MEEQLLSFPIPEPPKNIETSIIIRTKNEEKWLGKVLEKLFKQTYQDFKIIIIDSGSTDKTLEIAKQFKVKILQIPQADFSYPYALNYAIKRASATKYLVMLSAHSIPISDSWLEDGIAKFSSNHKIIGVFGTWKALPGSTFWDLLLENGFYHLIFTILPKGRLILSKPVPGILQFTNAIILKSCWDQKPFDEAYGMGGEDYQWAVFWLKKGYKIMFCKDFSVLHSHNLGLIGWGLQLKTWLSLGKPRPFKPYAFRKSPTHSQS